MQEAKKNRKKMQEELTRKHILDAAMQILLDEGPERLIMEHLAEKAGVAKGTLYLHFANKTTVLRAALERLFQPLFDKMEAIYQSDANPVRKLELGIRLGLEFFEERLHLFRILIHEREAFYDDRIEDDSPYWRFQAHIVTVLEQGVARGLFRPMNTDLVANMLLEAQGGQICLRIFGRTPSSIDEQVFNFMDVFLNGIANDQRNPS